jgi:hypothetical protein
MSLLERLHGADADAGELSQLLLGYFLPQLLREDRDLSGTRHPLRCLGARSALEPRPPRATPQFQWFRQL